MYSNLYKITAIITLLLSSFIAYAQEQVSHTVELDTLTKGIGIALTIGGFFMGYMQMRMANKIAEVESKFNKAISEVKDIFDNKIEQETKNLENKIAISGKEIEAKMATKHDIDNLKTIIKLEGEISKLSNEGLKEQLRLAASIYRKDKMP